MRYEPFHFLIQQLSLDSTVITANQRLAALINQAYNQKQKEKGLSSWNPIHCLPLNSWLIQQWQTHQTSRILNSKQFWPNPEQLLNSIQELAIFKQIIQSNHEMIPYLQINQTAELVQQAWDLFHHWQLNWSQLTEYHNPQVDCFINWAMLFQKYCQTHHWFTLSELPIRLKNYWQQNPPQLPKKIFVIGFDEISPLLQTFITSLQTLTEIMVVPLTGTLGECQRIELENQEQEISTFAAWASKLLDDDPNVKIGCIVPNLAACRQSIINELTNTFALHNKLSAYFHTTQSNLIYNISAGQNLVEFEAIYIALQIIQLLEGKINLESIGLLLQSPYLMHEPNNSDLGALLDFLIREYSFFQKLPLEILISHLNQIEKLMGPQFHSSESKNTVLSWKARWLSFYHAYQQQATYNLPSQWACYFESQLKKLGWPGCRQRNSFEFQLMQRWQQLLGEMTYLDSICGSISFNEAFHWLQSIASQTPFQPQGNPEARIQILGILESVGYQFDFLWIMGLHDENWPPPENPNPFLPFQLQQELEMPHASAVRQLNYTQKINERLLFSAKQIILSTPLKEGEKILRPSKLIENFSQVNLIEWSLKQQERFVDKIFRSRQLENLIDEIAPPIKILEVLTGGSSILTEQATCPFRAFALKRLKAKSLPKITFAFSSQHRGILLHHALATLWLQLKNQANLFNCSESEIAHLVTKSIQNAITSLFNQQQQQSLNAILEIEKKCLFKLIWHWLKLEIQRPGFSVIACEYQHVMEIGPLKIRMRIDRIDQLNDGGQIIIDYKTSASLSIQSWLNKPLEQPQLPLYSFISNECTAIAYAQIRADKIQFKGVCSENHSCPIGELPGIIPINQIKKNLATKNSKLGEIDLTPKDWNEIQFYWRTELTQLAENFYCGKATINPIHDKKTCLQCELNNLCRYR